MRQLKHLSLLLGLLLLGPSTYAQSVRFQSQAISSRGAGIANATVAVCTQPANTNTQPCSPLATLATSTITTSGGANPLTADSFGNFFFYAAPGNYTVQIYGPAVSGQFVTQDVVLSCDPTAICNFSGTSTFSGTSAVKNLNAIQMADQFTAGTLVLPTLGAAISTISTGGSIGTGTWACEITWKGGANGLESTASAASTALVISAGATNTLYCQPLDYPNGTSSYNVYWQTGGAGSFFQGHTGVALGTADTQTTTPPTTGPTPPVVNNATSKIAAAVTALGGNPGGVFIPSTMTLPNGAVGALSPGQLTLDFRNGTINMHPIQPSDMQKNGGGAPGGNSLSIDATYPSQLGTLQQSNVLQIIGHSQNTASYWGGTTSTASTNGAMTVISAFAIRDGTRAEQIWSGIFGANCANTLAQCTAHEIDIQEFGTAPVNNTTGGVAELIQVGGTQKVYEGIRVVPAPSSGVTGCPTSTAGCFNQDIDLGANTYTVNALSIGTCSTANCQPISVFAGGAGTGAGIYSEVTNANATAFRGNSTNANQNTCYSLSDAGTEKWTMCKDSSANFAISDAANSLARVQWNSGANGANVYQAPGTGAHSFNKSIVAGGTAAGLTGTGACATFGTNNSGAFAGSSSCTSATAASTLTITFTSVAAHGYACNVQDETTRANLFQQTSHTTISCTLTATSVTQNDVFVFSAIGF